METFDRSAARLLSVASEAVEARPDAPQVRREVVAAITQALVPVAPVAKRRWPAWVALGVAAAAAALWLAWPKPVAPPAPQLVQVPAPPVPQPVVVVPPPAPEPSPVAANERVLSSGARVSWVTGTELEFDDVGNSVLLRRGEIAADAVQAGVSIDTGDSQVFVRGRAQVVSSGGCDGRALVRVESGQSRVRSGGVEVRLQAGEEWPRCAPKREPFTLEQQNALYEEALIAQHSGRVDDAVRRLESLLRRAPDSALAETAMAQEFRWLAPVDRARAQAAARRYLSMFPMGSSRAEAEQVLAQ